MREPRAHLHNVQCVDFRVGRASVASSLLGGPGFEIQTLKHNDRRELRAQHIPLMNKASMRHKIVTRV